LEKGPAEVRSVDPSDERVRLLVRAYDAFNRRDVDAVLALLDPEVEWPNLLDHVVARGRDEVRAYWERQFRQIRSQVEPTAFIDAGDRVVVAVHQVVRDLDGGPVSDGEVAHAYAFRGLLVRAMRVFPTVDEAVAARA
jgi:ketosteroid isomerase-like protein